MGSSLINNFKVSGGSKTHQAHAGTDAWPCNIPRIGAIDFDQFKRDWSDKAVIVTGVTNNSYFRNLTQINALKSNYGDRRVILSHATTYSSRQRTVTFREYIERLMLPVTVDTASNETFYFFGDYQREEWHDLLQHYVLPPYYADGAMLSFGLGGDQSGVPFHYHGPGWSEVLHGQKRWFVQPNGVRPRFDHDRSTLQWLHEVYPSLSEAERPLECVIEPGEALYFPNSWYHATLNIGETVFVSTFIDYSKYIN